MDAADLRSILRYEPDTGRFFWLRPPKYHPNLLGKEAGQVVPNANGKLYHCIQINRRKYKRSRLAFFYMTGAFPPDQADHINGDSLDDRWENLRAATVTENSWNHHKRQKRQPLPMGVKHLPSGRFQARISVNKKHLSLGTFPTPHEAAAAYQAARRMHFGQFA